MISKTNDTVNWAMILIFTRFVLAIAMFGLLEELFGDLMRQIMSVRGCKI